MDCDNERNGLGGGVGGPDSSSGAGIISNGAASCTAAQSEPSPGPVSAAAHAAAQNGGKQNVPGHSVPRGDRVETSFSDDIANEGPTEGGGGPIPAIGQGVQKIRHSGVRTKFIVESLRMEMIALQRQNAKLRRIVAMRLPDRSDVIFEECCSVSASTAVAARESFIKKMAEEMANLDISGDDSDEGDDDDKVGENLHLYVSPDDDNDDDIIVKEADEAAATDDKANGQMGR